MARPLTYHPRRIRKPGGAVVWQVYCGRDGGNRAVRRRFSTKQEAETYAMQVRIQKENEGLEALELPLNVRAEAMEASRLLADLERVSGRKVTLLEAVRFFINHAQPSGGEHTAADVTVELINYKREAGCRDSYLNALKWSLGRFNETFGKKHLHTVSQIDCEQWLCKQKFSPATRNAYIRDVGILFRFGVMRKYCATNPMGGISRSRRDESPINHLSVKEAEKMLRLAEQTSDLELTPYLTIGLFCGLRSCELRQLDWADVSLKRGLITVKSTVAKGRRYRHVEISKNLAAWLAPFVKTSGLVVPLQLRPKLTKLRDLAGYGKGRWGEIHRNSLRHTFATYHLAYHQVAGKTALQLGHKEQDILFEHYRALATCDDAKRFWKIYPNCP